MNADGIGLVVLPHEKLYLDHLPSADRYFKSFMHRDVINFNVMTRCVFFALPSPSLPFLPFPSLPFFLSPPKLNLDPHTPHPAEPNSSSQPPSTGTSNSGKSKNKGSSSSSTTAPTSPPSSPSPRARTASCSRAWRRTGARRCLMLLISVRVSFFCCEEVLIEYVCACVRYDQHAEAAVCAQCVLLGASERAGAGVVGYVRSYPVLFSCCSS